jgi:hypothetical protein
MHPPVPCISTPSTPTGQYLFTFLLHSLGLLYASSLFRLYPSCTHSLFLSFASKRSFSHARIVLLCVGAQG